MQFMIETVTPARAGAGAIRGGRALALVPTLADAHRLAAEVCEDSPEALRRLAAMGSQPEGELSGEWGRVAFAPAG